MGIYIPNMEKPKNCKVCPFTCEKLAFFDGKNRPQGCPLIDIVTCGECVLYDDGICRRPKWAMGVEPTDFCKYGERRSE